MIKPYPYSRSALLALLIFSTDPSLVYAEESSLKSTHLHQKNQHQKKTHISHHTAHGAKQKKPLSAQTKKISVTPSSTPSSTSASINTSLNKGRLIPLPSSLQTTATTEYTDYVTLASNPTLEQTTSALNYLQQHPNTGWGDAVRQTWADYLAQQGQWSTLRHHAGLFSKGEAQCWTWQAYLNTGADLEDDWYHAVKQHWKTQVSPSNACQTVHQQLIRAGKVSAEDWQAKVYFALSQPKTKPSQLQDWLGDMPSRQAQATQRLIKDLSHPAEALAERKHFGYRSPESLHHDLVVLSQLANSDPQTAYAYWQKITQANTLHALIREPIERHLFWQLAKKDKDNAVAWLQKIPANRQDETTLTPIFNQAWQTSDWTLLLNTLALLPSADQQNPRWQYWQAKALQQLGKQSEAQAIWQTLARDRSFYGFLAADLLGTGYQLNTKQVSEEALARVEQNPLLTQLNTLYQAGLKDIAWREWRYRLKSGDIALGDIPAFAQKALGWGWTEFSVLSMGNPQHWDYVHLRFPMPYRDLLAQNSQAYNIPLAWAYAITRRESAYNAGVTSHSGAIGLMQLMPQTAKMVAKELGTNIKHKQEIYHPEFNVQLGTKHLSQLINSFDQNYLLATAAYNAGGARVKQWLKKNPNLATDQWIELIPFKETRDYVKAVLEYWQVFERLGELPQTQLATYLVALPKTSEPNATELALAPSEETAQQKESADSNTNATPSPSFLPFFDFF